MHAPALSRSRRAACPPRPRPRPSTSPRRRARHATWRMRPASVEAGVAASIHHGRSSVPELLAAQQERHLFAAPGSRSRQIHVIDSILEKPSSTTPPASASRARQRGPDMDLSVQLEAGPGELSLGTPRRYRFGPRADRRKLHAKVRLGGILLLNEVRHASTPSARGGTGC